MRSDELDALTLVDAARRIRERRLSPIELTEAVLERIARLDREVHAFITVTPEQALADAAGAESVLASGRETGLLHGVPISLKDLIDVRGTRTTAGSKVFAGGTATADATVARKLRAAGAIFVGKANMHECAYGVTLRTFITVRCVIRGTLNALPAARAADRLPRSYSEWLWARWGRTPADRSVFQQR